MSSTADNKTTDLQALLEKARKAVDGMTPQQRAHMLAQQRRSYVIAEAGMGSDKNEDEYRAAQEAGDWNRIAELNGEAEGRRRAAKDWLREQGL